MWYIREKEDRALFIGKYVIYFVHDLFCLAFFLCFEVHAHKFSVT